MVQLLFQKDSFQGKRGERPDRTTDAEQDMLGLQSNAQQTESSQETQRRWSTLASTQRTNSFFQPAR